MLRLDDPRLWERLDPAGMRHLIESFPDQLVEGAELAFRLALPPPPVIENVILAGMGGSAIGGDVVRSAFGDRLKVPFAIGRDYRLPGFAGRRSAVIASSYSGNTEETLEAYRQAKLAGATVVCVASGGKLAALAGAEGTPLIRIPGGLPPRASLGYSITSVLGCLAALRLLNDPRPALDESAALLRMLGRRYAIKTPERLNPAKKLARSLHGRIIAVYAAADPLEAAAVRWRGQLEENAKNLAFHHLLPEMNHNELVGWDRPGRLVCRLGVVLLRDAEEHPQVRRRFELSSRILKKKAAVTHEVWSRGESRLARILSLICLGDFVSLHLAALNGVDPTPVVVIENLKARLARKSTAVAGGIGHAD